MPEFRTQYDRERVFADSGSPIRPVYSSMYDENGRLQIVQEGEENLYDFIQSHKDSVDIHVILAKFKNGDPDILNRRQGSYGDFTGMPTTYAEMLNMVHAAEDSFNDLPLDVRQKFDMNMGTWLSMYGSPEWCDRMGIKPEVSDPEPVPEDPDVST